jgi:phage terminase large subunit-like protein
MTAPTKELEKMILSRSIKHNNHPALNWCMSNVSVEQDPAGNIKPSKKKSTEKIDCAVAMINAIACALAKPQSPSVYETRGILEL